MNGVAIFETELKILFLWKYVSFCVSNSPTSVPKVHLKYTSFIDITRYFRLIFSTTLWSCTKNAKKQMSDMKGHFVGLSSCWKMQSMREGLFQGLKNWYHKYVKCHKALALHSKSIFGKFPQNQWAFSLSLKKVRKWCPESWLCIIVIVFTVGL